jgi:hypothetical protein
MKKTTFLILLLAAFSAHAQEVPKSDEAQKKVADALTTKDLKGDFKEGWNKNSSFGTTVNITGFSDSWRQVNTGVVGNTNLHFILKHQNALVKGKNIWINDFEGQLGFQSTGKDEVTRKKVFNRNIDKLFINSLYGRKISDKVSAFAEGNFISQFLSVKDKNAETRRNIASAFMTPGYLTISTGIEYRPADYFTVKFAPIANKWTFVSHKNVQIDTTSGLAYGVNIADGKKSLSEFGSQLTLGFNKEVMKNVNLGFRYNFFKAWKDSEENKNKPLDHRLDLLATAKINKYLNVNFTYIGILDKDIFNHKAYNNATPKPIDPIRSSWQSASGFGIGFLATF